MSTTFTIDFHNSRIHVYQYGSGKRLLLLFHGFSESGASYPFLESLLGKEYSIFIPDLPFHGETQWGDYPLTTALLAELARRLMQKAGADSFSLLGYSMGGRPAICLAQQEPLLIDQLLLIAPEGLRKNRWFLFATGTILGQWVFKQVTFRPGLITGLANLCKNLGIISRSKAKYVQNLMKDRAARLRVYHCWLCFRTLDTHPFSFKKNKIPLRFIFGQYDQLIPPPSAKERKQWAAARLSVIPTGHLLFQHEALLKEIYTYLCRPAKHK